jgi:hypothetical protein
MNISNWFTAVVEDVNDPLQQGRVRVRCLGYHTDNTTDLPKEDLPWATCIMPVTSPGVSGIGQSATGLVPGSWVFGFFRDALELQDPVVVGSIASAVGYDNGLGTIGQGFSDPHGVFPYKAGSDMPTGAAINSRTSSGYAAQATSAQNFGGAAVASGGALSSLEQPSTPIVVNSASKTKMIQAAQSKVGNTYETSTNQGPGIAEMWQATNFPNGYNARAPWCAAFVCWCIQQSGIFSEEDRPKTAVAWKPSMGGGFEEWARSKSSVVKLTHRPNKIYAGDLVCFNVSHIGIAVTDSDANGNFSTIEGNTNLAGSREGNGVYLKKRRIAGVRSTCTIMT